MSHLRSKAFIVLLLVILGAYAEEYRMEQSEMELQAEKILSAFRAKFDKSRVTKNDAQQIMPFLMSYIKRIASDMDRREPQVREKESFLSRGTRE